MLRKEEASDEILKSSLEKNRLNLGETAQLIEGEKHFIILFCSETGGDWRLVGVYCELSAGLIPSPCPGGKNHLRKFCSF